MDQNLHANTSNSEKPDRSSDIERERLELDRARIVLETKRTKVETSLLNKHFGTIITFIVAAASVWVSWLQFKTHKVEVEQSRATSAVQFAAVKEQQDRQWKWELAKFVIEHSSEIENGTLEQKERVARLMTIGFPSDLVYSAFESFARKSRDPKTKREWIKLRDESDNSPVLLAEVKPAEIKPPEVKPPSSSTESTSRKPPILRIYIAQNTDPSRGPTDFGETPVGGQSQPLLMGERCSDSDEPDFCEYEIRITGPFALLYRGEPEVVNGVKVYKRTVTTQSYANHFALVFTPLLPGQATGTLEVRTNHSSLAADVGTFPLHGIGVAR